MAVYKEGFLGFTLKQRIKNLYYGGPQVAETTAKDYIAGSAEKNCS